MACLLCLARWVGPRIEEIHGMRGNETVIAHLNEALREELTAINQYFLHAEMCHNWGYHGLGGFIKKQSIDEMKHAEELIERLLFLDATPKMEYLDLNIGQSVKEQIEADLKLETNAVAMYNKAVQAAREAGDDQSRELFSEILSRAYSSTVLATFARSSPYARIC